MSARIAPVTGAIAVLILLIAAACGGGAGGEPTATPTAAAWPTPATEGQFQIAYVDDEEHDIWVVPADGIGPRNVTVGGCPRPSQFYWAPTGDRIACISSVYDGKAETQILVFDLDGRLLFDLKRNALFAGFSWTEMSAKSPSSLWSPTGEYLAYVLEEGLTPVAGGGSRGTLHLYIAETEQGHIRKSIPGGQQPRWSADGSRIAYNKPPDDTLVLYEPDTGEEKVLGTGLRPLAWALHDTSLLVAAGFHYPNEWLVEYEANLLDLSSGEMTRVPELDNNAEFWLSPDGTEAAVLRAGTSLPSLGVLDLMRLRLTDIAGSVISYPSEYIPRHQFTSTPDGSRIYWFDGNEAIYSANSDGSDLTRVGPLPGLAWFAGFSPDVTEVLYLVLSRASPPAEGGPWPQDLWVANVDGSDARLVVENASMAVWGPQASLTKPTTIDGIRVVPLQFGEEMELPGDVALIIETGCYQCDGPPTGLYRLYRDASGQLRTDALFTIEALGLPPRGGTREEAWVDEPYITGLALNDDASQIVAGVCTRGYCGGLGFPTADAQMTLYRSSDGGVTWTQLGLFDGGGWVTAITNDDVVVSGPYRPEEQTAPKFTLFPSGEPVELPPGPTVYWPLTLPGGELAWRTEDGRLLRSDGSEVLQLGEGAYVGDIVPDAHGERLAVTWSESASSQSRVGVFSRDGRAISAFSLSDSVHLGEWLSDTLIAGNAGVPSGLLPTPEPGSYATNFVPVVIELQTGEARPLAGPFHELPLSGRNYVRAVLHGPFARVVDTGACLNVRAESAMAAPVLACAADGVLLHDTGETREADGATWRRVVTPAGVEGWASSQHLER